MLTVLYFALISCNKRVIHSYNYISVLQLALHTHTQKRLSINEIRRWTTRVPCGVFDHSNRVTWQLGYVCANCNVPYEVEVLQEVGKEKVDRKLIVYSLAQLTRDDELTASHSLWAPLCFFSQKTNGCPLHLNDLETLTSDGKQRFLSPEP